MALDAPSQKQYRDTIKYHFEHGDVDAAKAAIMECLKQNKRQGIKFSAAKLIMEHEKDLYKHAQGTKSEHDVTIKIIDVDDNGKEVE